MSKTKIEAAAEWVDINVLLPWEDNPRDNEHAVDSVAESIKRFGFASPIIARSENKEVIAGHTRLLAAQKLGLDRVPVRFLDLDPVDARLLALADNKVGELADWDNLKLAELLKDIANDGGNIEGLGWNNDELQAIIDGPDDYSAPEDSELDVNDFSEFAHTCPRCSFEWDE
jgi:hypothetical protein